MFVRGRAQLQAAALSGFAGGASCGACEPPAAGKFAVGTADTRDLLLPRFSQDEGMDVNLDVDIVSSQHAVPTRRSVRHRRESFARIEYQPLQHNPEILLPQSGALQELEALSDLDVQYSYLEAHSDARDGGSVIVADLPQQDEEANERVLDTGLHTGKRPRQTSPNVEGHSLQGLAAGSSASTSQHRTRRKGDSDVLAAGVAALEQQRRALGLAPSVDGPPSTSDASNEHRANSTRERRGRQQMQRPGGHSDGELKPRQSGKLEQSGFAGRNATRGSTIRSSSSSSSNGSRSSSTHSSSNTSDYSGAASARLTTKLKHAASLDELASVFNANQATLNPVHAACTVNRLAKLPHPTRQQARDLQGRVLQRTDELVADAAAAGLYKSWELCNIVWGWGRIGHQPSPATWSAVSNALFGSQGGSSGSLHTSGSDSQAAIGTACAGLLGDSNTRALSNLAWGMCKLRRGEAGQWRQLAEALRERIAECNAFDLSSTAYAFVAANQYDMRLFVQIARAAVTQIGDFCPQDLANLLWAFAHAAHPNKQLFGAATSAVLHTLPGFTQEGLVQVLWAYATIGRREQQLVDAMARACLGQLASFTAQNLSLLAWSLVRLRALAPPQPAGSSGSGSDSDEGMDRAGWASGLQGSGAAGTSSSSNSGTGTSGSGSIPGIKGSFSRSGNFKPLVGRRLLESTPGEAANAPAAASSNTAAPVVPALGVAADGSRPRSATAPAVPAAVSLLPGLASAALLKLDHFKPRELAVLLWALASARYGDEQLFRAAAHVMKTHIAGTTTTASSAAAKGSSAGTAAGSGSGMVASSSSSSSSSSEGSVNTQDLANVAWAYSMAGMYDADLYKVVVESALAHINDVVATPPAVANLVAALGVVGHLDEKLMARLCGAVARGAAQYDTEQLSLVLMGLAMLGYNTTRQAQAAVAAATAELRARLGTRTARMHSGGLDAGSGAGSAAGDGQQEDELAAGSGMRGGSSSGSSRQGVGSSGRDVPVSHTVLSTIAWSLAVLGRKDMELLGLVFDHASGLVRSGLGRGAGGAAATAPSAAQVASASVGRTSLGRYMHAYLWVKDILRRHRELPVTGLLLDTMTRAWRQSTIQHSQPSEFALHLSKALAAMGLSPQLEALTADACVSLDILVAYQGVQVAVEANGPAHYLANRPHTPSGVQALKDALIRRRGYALVNVPYYEWSRLQDQERPAVQKYLQRMLDTAVEQYRADKAAGAVFLQSSPTTSAVIGAAEASLYKQRSVMRRSRTIRNAAQLPEPTPPRRAVAGRWGLGSQQQQQQQQRQQRQRQYDTMAPPGQGRGQASSNSTGNAVGSGTGHTSVNGYADGGGSSSGSGGAWGKRPGRAYRGSARGRMEADDDGGDNAREAVPVRVSRGAGYTSSASAGSDGGSGQRADHGGQRGAASGVHSSVTEAEGAVRVSSS